MGEYGITVPVVPGIMCLTSYGGLCRTRVPAGMMEAAKEAADKSDDEFKAWGITMGVELCKNLLGEGGATALHFYTLNLEKVAVGTLLGLGMITQEQADQCQKTDADAKSMVSAQGITVDKK